MLYWKQILSCVLLSALLGAQPLLVIERNMGSCSYGKFAVAYEDKSCKADIREIITKKDSFATCLDEIPNFNITKSAMWLKLKITTRERKDWKIEASNASLNSIDFYTVRNNMVVSHQVSGMMVPDDKRTYVGGHILFDSGLKPYDTLDVYLRLETVGPMNVPIRIGSTQDFFNRDHFSNLLHGSYFGIMVLMVLYNLFLFFTNRSLVYVYYILYIIFSGFFIAFFLGYTMMFPAPVRTIFVKIPVVVPVMFGLFGLLFTTKFLNTKELAPRYHQAIKIFIYLVVIPFGLSVSGFGHESVGVIQVYGVVLAILCLSVGIRVLREGYRPAKFYVLGFGSYMLGLLMLIVSNASHTSILGLENYALEFGSALEAVMLSFAIGDKLNIANAEKTEAQARVMETLRENERIIREQNVFLEQKVRERTLELEEKKNLVMEQNKDILDSIRYAKRIQDSLLPNEKFIGRVLKGFKNP